MADGRPAHPAETALVATIQRELTAHNVSAQDYRY